MKKNLLLCLTLTFSLALTACGFRLKGLGSDKPAFDRLYLVNAQQEQNYERNLPFEILKESLEDNHITLVGNESASEWQLVVSDYRQTRRETAIGSNNTRELQLTAAYRVTLFKNGENQGANTVSAQSNIEYSAGQYLGSTAEEAAAIEQMARDNAAAVLRFLNTKSRQ